MYAYRAALADRVLERDGRREAGRRGPRSSEAKPPLRTAGGIKTENIAQRLRLCVGGVVGDDHKTGTALMHDVFSAIARH